MKIQRNTKYGCRVWHSRSQIAERIGRSRQTIWRWQRDGLLPQPDGTDPFGNPMWLAATIDTFFAVIRRDA